LEAQNALNYSRRVPFITAQMPSISLHDSQSWTELTVIYVITGELRKLTQQPRDLILICWNQSLKVTTMILKKMTMKGWNPKSWPSRLYYMVFISLAKSDKSCPALIKCHFVSVTCLMLVVPVAFSFYQVWLYH